MIPYRPQRSTLQESLNEQVRFQTETDMKGYIAAHSYGYLKEEDIVLDSEKQDDTRIQWKDVQYVCVKKLANLDYIQLYGCPQAIGYCSSNVPPLPTPTGDAAGGLHKANQTGRQPDGELCDECTCTDCRTCEKWRNKSE